MTTIASFFAQRSVFITGGYGFVGQQTIEKLLRSCPEIESIYVLTRPKKGQDAQQRVNKLISSPLFDRLRSQHPRFDRKIIPVTGDIELPGLGISDADHNRITSNVSLFLHVAASIHLTDTIRNETKANLFGTRNAISLCKELKHPEAFIHMSTVATQAEKTYVKEDFYEPKINAKQLTDLISCLTDEQLKTLESSLIHPLTNTYSFAKAAGEYEVKDTIGNIPCAVVRTGFIGAALAEPIPGFCDNPNAGNAFCAGIGLGMLPAVNARAESLLDVTPVDLLANFLIAVTWHTAVNNKSLECLASAPKVYNFVTGNESPLSMKEFISQISKNFQRYPLSQRITNWSGYTTENKAALAMYSYLLRIRCQAIDAATQLRGGKPKAMKLYRIYTLNNIIFEYFLKHTFYWDQDNVREVESQLSPIDKQIFAVGRKIDWDQYFLNSCLGIKKYFFKESQIGTQSTKDDAILENNGHDTKQPSC